MWQQEETAGLELGTAVLLPCYLVVLELRVDQVFLDNLPTSGQEGNFERDKLGFLFKGSGCSKY
jgi:hypothetical protein